MMKKLNLYFFGEEEISLHDFLWFYGMIAFITFVAAVAIIPAQIQLWMVK